MNILRNFLAMVLGVVVGAVVNSGLITGGSALFPPPGNVDPMDAESIAAAMPLYEPHDFAIPFVAHAVGTLAGALVVYLLAASAKSTFAFGMGAFFLIGGIVASIMIQAPLWFVALDLVGAYFPMAWLAILIGRKLVPGSS